MHIYSCCAIHVEGNTEYRNKSIEYKHCIIITKNNPIPGGLALIYCCPKCMLTASFICWQKSSQVKLLETVDHFCGGLLPLKFVLTASFLHIPSSHVLSFPCTHTLPFLWHPQISPFQLSSVFILLLHQLEFTVCFQAFLFQNCHELLLLSN